jgi:Methyltransferase domain
MQDKSTSMNPAWSFETALRSMDERLFGYIPTETSRGDRLSLLALYNACHRWYGDFAYLEIGSHLGGTLQVLLADERCTAITSIDPRPPAVRDVRGDPVPYPENSTERMLKYLELVPGGDLSKLGTIEASTEDLVADAILDAPKLCFIDGEHTVSAALRDARFCRSVVRDEGVIVFHDRGLVRPAIDAFVAELETVPHQSFPLPNSVWVVSLGSARLLHDVQGFLAQHLETFARVVENRASRRSENRGHEQD